MAADIKVENAKVRVSKNGRRAAWFGWTAFGLSLMPLLAWIVGDGLLQLDPIFWAPSAIAYLGAGIAAIPGLLQMTGRADFAEVSVESDRILVLRDDGNEMPVLLEDILSGTVVPGAGLVLAMNDGRTITIYTDERNAEKLLAATGLATDRRRFETQFRPAGTRSIALSACVLVVHLVAIFVMAARASPMAALTLLLGASAVVTATILATRQPQIEVGSDGILIRHKTRREFVRHEEIIDAELSGDHRKLKITTNDAVRKMAIPVGHRKEALALLRRVQRARAAHAVDPSAPARLALLGRGGRDMHTWRAELATLLHQEAGFRRSPMSRDDLEAILAAPGTYTHHRVAAAMALQSAEDSAVEGQIRIAAEACADTEARAALLRIADEDYEHAAVEAALADAEQDDRAV